MDNLDLLKEVLMSKEEYWIVARRNDYRDYGRWKRGDDSILLICIPTNIRRELAAHEIMLSDVENLQRAEVNNIFLSEPFPPFQHGITMYNIYKGYPITDGIYVKDFLIKALQLGGSSIYSYKELLDEYSNKEQKLVI